MKIERIALNFFFFFLFLSFVSFGNAYLFNENFLNTVPIHLNSTDKNIYDFDSLSVLFYGDSLNVWKLYNKGSGSSNSYIDVINSSNGLKLSSSPFGINGLDSGIITKLPYMLTKKSNLTIDLNNRDSSGLNGDGAVCFYESSVTLANPFLCFVNSSFSAYLGEGRHIHNLGFSLSRRILNFNLFDSGMTEEEIKKAKFLSISINSYNSGGTNYPIILYNITLTNLTIFFENNSLPSCNFTINQNNCYNDTILSLDYNMTCFDLENDDVYFFSYSESINQKHFILNPEYLFDSFSFSFLDFNYYQDILNLDYSLLNNLDINDSLNYCKVCKGVLDCAMASGELNKNGIFLINDINSKNGMYSLKVNQEICKDKYAIIRYKFNYDVSKVTIVFKFDIENNTNSKNKYLKYSLSDSNFLSNLVTYKFYLNNSDGNINFYRYNLETGIAEKITEQPYRDSDGEKILYGFYDNIDLENNTENILIFYNEKSISHSVFTANYIDLRFKNISQIGGISFNPYLLNGDNMTFYIGNLYIFSAVNENLSSWSKNNPEFIFNAQETKLLRLYYTDFVHLENSYDYVELTYALQVCDNRINPESQIGEWKDLATGIKSFNSVLCSEFENLLNKNNNTGHKINLCKWIVYISFFIALFFSIGLTFFISSSSKNIISAPDLLLGMFFIFQFIFIFVFQFIIDYSSHNTMKIISGLMFFVGCVLVLRFFIFPSNSMNNNGGIE